MSTAAAGMGGGVVTVGAAAGAAAPPCSRGAAEDLLAVPATVIGLSLALACIREHRGHYCCSPAPVCTSLGLPSLQRLNGQRVGRVGAVL